jgi:hypothetical protein
MCFIHDAIHLFYHFGILFCKVIFLSDIICESLQLNWSIRICAPLIVRAIVRGKDDQGIIGNPQL